MYDVGGIMMWVDGWKNTIHFDSDVFKYCASLSTLSLVGIIHV